jgi:hypothetical protein
MRFRRITRNALTLAVGTGLALAATLPANATLRTPAGTFLRWRVVKTYGPTQSGILTNLTAVSATDSWLTWVGWDGGAGHQVAHNAVVRWDGIAWRNVPVPANLEIYAQDTLAVAASSPRNAWLFNSFDPANGANFTKALRWTGNGWRLVTLPSWVVRLNAAGEVDLRAMAFSTTNMWVFSLGDTFGPHASLTHFAARYNGHTWSKMTLPLIPYEVSAVSATDIWVRGVTLTTGNFALAHWNGRKWTTIGDPRLTAPKGWVATLVNMLAVGPSSVWGVERYDKLSDPAGPEPWNLQHWDGKSWVKIGFPFPTDGAGSIAPDGHGGLWVSVAPPGGTGRAYIYHWAGGHWTRYSLPIGTQEPIWIPGTRSMWAISGFGVGSYIEGAILKYGP